MHKLLAVKFFCFLALRSCLLQIRTDAELRASGSLFWKVMKRFTDFMETEDLSGDARARYWNPLREG
jgi:hypothetical protein